MANLRQVAKLAGVSTATVSNVLNMRNDQVGAETREAVLAAVRQLRYRLPAENDGHSLVRTRNVGVVMRNVSESPLSEPTYFSGVLDGIVGSAAQEKWSVTLYMEEMWEDIRQGVRRYCDGRCDGLILIATAAESETVRALQERGTPFILLGSGNGSPSVSSVDVDSESAAAEAVRYLHSLGHRRIACLTGTNVEDSSVERARGYSKAVEELGLAGYSKVLWGGYGRESGVEMATRLILENDLPTAILCATDSIAHGAMDVFRDRGIRVPQDISLVGFDDLPESSSSNPPLTSIQQPLSEIGRRAFRMLIDAIRTHHPARESVQFPTKLVVRGSTAPPGKAASNPS